MKAKEKLSALYDKLDLKCLQQFGFHIKDAKFNKIVDYMYEPKNSSSLAVTRILFGLAMLFDIPDERGGASMAKRWGDPTMCHFPLLPVIQPMPLPYMALVYAALWFGALGIMLGYKYTITAPMFTLCYWYLFLIEKSYWNNHSYLFGLVALLLSCTEANRYWSLDTYLDPSKKKLTVPYWNYFVLKYQFFILYFMAGMKKGTAEWLTGYSVQNLSEHWVFDPFKYFLTVRQTDYLVVHWFVFMFDLTVAVWMMLAYTRHVAMVFCALFHLMNSRLFRIGMFPWVCLATMPLFYPFDWPKRVASYVKIFYIKSTAYVLTKISELNLTAVFKCTMTSSEDDSLNTKPNSNVLNKECVKDTEDSSDDNNYEFTKRDDNANENDECDIDGKEMKDDVTDDVDEVTSLQRKRTVHLIACYVFLQAFLPYSHFITKGFNNWTEGLYGYSWDMMVHTWDSSSIVIKVVDNDSKAEMYIDPEIYTPNDRWSRHGDMIHQYARCLKNNLERTRSDCANPSRILSKNISVFVDIWCAMNGRFVQRMFDPKVDLLRANWSPLRVVPYLMPLLDEATHWRKDLDEIRNNVHSWNNYSDVVFFADFPGYEQEKFISLDFKNVTLTVLEGIVVYEPEAHKNQIGQSYRLTSRDNIKVKSGIFHKVLNIGQQPAFYMYTFYNETDQNTKRPVDLNKNKLPILAELYRRFYGMIAFGNLVITNIFHFFKFSQCY